MFAAETFSGTHVDFTIAEILTLLVLVAGIVATFIRSEMRVRAVEKTLEESNRRHVALQNMHTICSREQSERYQEIIKSLGELMVRQAETRTRVEDLIRMNGKGKNDEPSGFGARG